MNNNKINLRKCKVKGYENIFYFHRWIENDYQRVAASPEGDRFFAETLALLEDYDTGEVLTFVPSDVTFIK